MEGIKCDVKSDHYLAPFIKKKNRHINVTRRFWGSTCPGCVPVSDGPGYINNDFKIQDLANKNIFKNAATILVSNCLGDWI